MKNTTVYMALGSNRGDRMAYLEKARNCLQNSGISITKASKIYETKPLYKEDGEKWFLNQVLETKTSLSPLDVLKKIGGIEIHLGRDAAQHPGPRNIDIDILLFGSETIDLPELKIPHPRMHKRRCVMVPLIEIATELKDPVSGKTFKTILSKCADKNKTIPFL